MMKHSFYLLLGISFLVASGCGETGNDASPVESDTSASSPSESAAKTYETRGFIQELVPDAQGAFIHHEEIPDFMDEMTMYLKVAEQDEFKGLQIGHQYEFDLMVDPETGTVVKNFKPTGKVSEIAQQAETPSERWSQAPTIELLTHPLILFAPIPTAKKSAPPCSKTTSGPSPLSSPAVPCPITAP